MVTNRTDSWSKLNWIKGFPCPGHFFSLARLDILLRRLQVGGRNQLLLGSSRPKTLASAFEFPTRSIRSWAYYDVVDTNAVWRDVVVADRHQRTLDDDDQLPREGLQPFCDAKWVPSIPHLHDESHCYENPFEIHESTVF